MTLPDDRDTRSELDGDASPVGWVVIATDLGTGDEYVVSPMRPTRAYAEQEMAARAADGWSWIAGYRIGVVRDA